ncbi:MAG: helix-turn-helix transcriptional regulator [Lachnospiraceae bacterium]|nr:helix-turn-helix transcriptional regulator [Lachnospiraceae bacterium]
MYERIRSMRKDKNMTQAKVAKLLNVHQTTYSHYEVGNLNIPIPTINRLADLFETSIDYLVDRTDDPRPYPYQRRRHHKRMKKTD